MGGGEKPQKIEGFLPSKKKGGINFGGKENPQPIFREIGELKIFLLWGETQGIGAGGIYQKAIFCGRGENFGGGFKKNRGPPAICFEKNKKPEKGQKKFTKAKGKKILF